MQCVNVFRVCCVCTVCCVLCAVFEVCLVSMSNVRSVWKVRSVCNVCSVCAMCAVSALRAECIWPAACAACEACAICTVCTVCTVSVAQQNPKNALQQRRFFLQTKCILLATQYEKFNIFLLTLSTCQLLADELPSGVLVSGGSRQRRHQGWEPHPPRQHHRGRGHKRVGPHDQQS
jgi:hypothetical protein